MSLRWRESGELICGAKSIPETGDVYFDDGQQYEMSKRGLIIPCDHEETTGLWKWQIPLIKPDWNTD